MEALVSTGPPVLHRQQPCGTGRIPALYPVTPGLLVTETGDQRGDDEAAEREAGDQGPHLRIDRDFLGEFGLSASPVVRLSVHDQFLMFGSYWPGTFTWAGKISPEPWAMGASLSGSVAHCCQESSSPRNQSQGPFPTQSSSMDFFAASTVTCRVGSAPSYRAMYRIGPSCTMARSSAISVRRPLRVFSSARPRCTQRDRRLDVSSSSLRRRLISLFTTGRTASTAMPRQISQN